MGKFRAVCHDFWWTHLDEVIAIWLIEVFGQEVFPGLTLDNVLVLGKDISLGDIWTPELIFIGLGNGRFDDHSKKGKGKGRSAAQMVADELKLSSKHPCLGAMLAWVNNVDLNGPQGVGDMAYSLLEFENQQEAISWARIGLHNSVMRRYRSRFDPKTHEVWKNARKVNFRTDREYQIAMVQLPQGLDSISALAINGDDVKSPDILVQYRPSGHCSIVGNNKRMVDLENAWLILSQWESEKQSGKVWHRERKNDCTGSIVNGGKTHACIVPATKLPKLDIQRALVLGQDSSSQVTSYVNKLQRRWNIDEE